MQHRQQERGASLRSSSFRTVSYAAERDPLMK